MFDRKARRDDPAARSSTRLAANSPIVRLQRDAGNRAVSGLLQHGTEDAVPAGRVTDVGEPDHLSSPELAGPEFDAAYHNSPQLRVGDPRRVTVAQLQVLLAKRFGLRAAMPRTFAGGVADGLWGGETTAAVRDFQQRHGVRPVGGWEAGHKTLLAMDRALRGGAGPRPAPPVPASPEIRLNPATGPEAGPRDKGGDVPYAIRVIGTGFPPGTPLFIMFEDEGPAHAVSRADGTFSRSINAARRAVGTYRILTRGLTFDTAATFRVERAGLIPLDPAHEKLYAHFLREATRMLRNANFGTPLSSDFEHDRFDKEFWEDTDDPRWNRVLKLKEGKLPSQAIDALFDRLTAWNVDCDHTVQIANLYAIRKVLGAARFDARQNLALVLRPRNSSGLTTRLHHARLGPTGSWRIVHEFAPPNRFVFAAGPPTNEITDDLVARAPVGSRVRWTNLRAPEDSAFRHENAVKLGPDTFAAAGIDDPLTGNEFTRDRLEIELALMTAKRPSRSDIRATVYIDEVEVFDRA